MYLGTIDNAPGWRKWIWLFFLFVIAFCVFIFDYALSQVTIRIYPKNTAEAIDTQVVIDGHATTPNIDQLVFPARVVSIPISVVNTLPTTGTREVTGFAAGGIIVENKRDKDVALPKGFKVIQGDRPVEGQTWKDKIIFALDSDIVIPAGGQTTASVTAINKGQRGNIDAGPLYFSSMGAWNRERIIPKASQPFSGGISIERHVLADDIDLAKDQLLTQAKNQAVRKVCDSPAQSQSCQKELTFIDIENYSSDKQIDEMTETFNATLTGTAHVMIFSRQDIESALKKRLEEKFGTLELVGIDESSLKLSGASLDFPNEKAAMQAALSGTFAPKFSSEVFEKKSLVGFNENAIRQHFSTNPFIDHIAVRFFPFWRKTVPSLEDHTFVEIMK